MIINGLRGKKNPIRKEYKGKRRGKSGVGSNYFTCSSVHISRRSVKGNCRAVPGINRVPELYPEDILRNPVYQFRKGRDGEYIQYIHICVPGLKLSWNLTVLQLSLLSVPSARLAVRVSSIPSWLLRHCLQYSWKMFLFA